MNFYDLLDLLVTGLRILILVPIPLQTFIEQRESRIKS